MYMTLYRSETVLVRKNTRSWETYAVTVTQRDGAVLHQRFSGETAWCDAERFASDHDMAALGCTEGA